MFCSTYLPLCWALYNCLTRFIFSGQEDYSFKELLPMAVIGVIGGLLGTSMFPGWMALYGLLFSKRFNFSFLFQELYLISLHFI